MKKKLKSFWRLLVDNSTFFTKLEILRNRNKYPSRIINTVPNSHKPTIHFIHRYITTNTGDMACGYYQYFLDSFKDFNCIIHDINSVDLNLISNKDVAIIGGGGLINANTEWSYNINKVSKIAKNTIIWSAGFNTHYGTFIKIKIDWSKINLVSVRDYNYKDFRYVPCATCAIKYFDKSFKIKRKYGVIGHQNNLNDIPDEMRKYDSISNDDTVENIIDFIGSSEIILTNSYHAAYWSILLEKKCIVFSAFSEKFNYYKYMPEFYSGNLDSDILKCKIYPDALKEARIKNNSFLNDIISLINKC